jgi:hypothetical protein
MTSSGIESNKLYRRVSNNETEIFITFGILGNATIAMGRGSF